MRITGIVWLRSVVDKLLWKHNVTTDEAEQVFSGSPRFASLRPATLTVKTRMRRSARPKPATTVVFFVHKTTGDAMVISAREMTKKERKAYAKK